MAKKDAAVAEAPAPVQIEDVGPCRKKLTFEIPAERVTQAVADKFGGLAGQVSLPGFRPGKAPRSLVEKRFGAAIRDEAKQELVTEAYQACIEENSLRVLGEPEGGDELKDADMSGKQPLKFSVEVEVAPDFELPKLEGMEVLKPLFEVTEEMVERELKQLQNNEGDLEGREKAEMGDYCLGHGKLLHKDETILDIEGAVIQVPPAEKKGEGMILGVVVSDFAKQIGEPGKGDTITVKTKGPENHETESIRGKDIVIEFQVNEVYRIVPATTGALVAKYGFESEEQLRETIMLKLNQRVMIEQQQAMRQQIAKHLIDSVEIELPESITARQAERNLERQRMEMMHRGTPVEKIEEHIAEMRSGSSEVAGRELKLFFILDKVATQEDVTISENEVYGRIAQMAASNNQRPEELRNELVRTGRINGVAQQIREHKALDAVLAKANVKEVSMEDFRAAMEKKSNT
ncbi:MAG: trigger factor [Phycisphaeraceae bacterium]|nr:MAG: trigger factor [Phycisphaeraceae bacterium]